MSFLADLTGAVAARDLDAIVDCFEPDYVNQTPAHPSQGFRGSEQVRRNWAGILAGVPDLDARVLSSVVDGDRVWSEWDMSGTRTNGTPHHLVGVIVFTVRDGRASACRFYLEPVGT